MSTEAPLKLLIAPAFLSDHGGFEENVAGVAQVASELGSTVTILTALELPQGFRSRKRLESTSNLVSCEGLWLASPVARLLGARPRLEEGAERSLLSRIAERVARSRLKKPWRSSKVRHIIGGHDLVHLFGKPKPFLSGVAEAARAAGVSLIYTEVAEVSAEYAAAHAAAIRSIGASDLMTAYSERQAAAMRTHFRYSKPIHVVEQWAFSVEKELLALPLSLSSPNGPVRIASLSRLSSEKGLDVLIRAFAKARSECSDLELTIAGTGPHASFLQRLADSIGAPVDFCGFVEDKVQFLAATDIFVVTSLEEGGPISGVEAMAAGRAIISTPVGAMPERIESETSGQLTPIGDVDALACALLRLARDPAQRQHFGEGARSVYVRRNLRSLGSHALVKAWSAAQHLLPA